ncbi:glycoprotein-N-acetylgalactosamine 3-beta-galactosyltransferase 1 [Biomphalaria glabrata]|uniref:N-acetylgalactosaminide beta-1,3-galactosyltransferase n=1 Tax=Biomphalaria glabrata TaxID=6526 RepID=A0A9W2ZHM2_BIOGL|nr:glycoprotein-N-acetylgalactosamine 3-beta-galactosyltransferase 1-like [Biomphalaria glabrata]XP_055874441.1 glycoprotein-N-acetylgalactosamine 3-beta-galactosyltransferase 1-like [Biomphalaria glabrata]XP_055874442.1 glycoprotein-N-acetylgalactosamine 3-beta-galactosyltransferase 1-like [Biomphalaria glabrata]XP_055874443.1 glycoprotein-N-acetylgalactosamine 3-beta-galactosyltransferase 1-like [Biomphalaria glabrata]KAI8767999.1 glycoprotein-N-acetylgalactosamine 3-beta-galactosyltransferas
MKFLSVLWTRQKRLASTCQIFLLLFNFGAIVYFIVAYASPRDVIAMNINQNLDLHTNQTRKTTTRSIFITDTFNDTVAKTLKEKVRVLIWVMTSPSTLDTRAKAVNDTWGPRCNKLLFFSSKADSSFPVIGLNVSEGRSHLTAKSSQAWMYIYKNHFNDADWFMKVDDDSYVVLENLRYFLSDKNFSETHYFGHTFKRENLTFYSGGSGYVMSKESLRVLNEVGYAKKLCDEDGEFEDLRMSKCMKLMGVPTVNTVDDQGRNRFNCLAMYAHLVGLYPPWYYELDINGAKKGKDSISNYAISFHYNHHQEMYIIDFVLYNLQTYGITRH